MLNPEKNLTVGRAEIMAEQKVGVVVHYWGKIGVAGLKIIDGELRVGDTIAIRGHTSNFTQRVESMQIERQSVEVARSGDDIGMKVIEHAREHDEVFKITPDS
jgi:putative protease